MAAGTVAVVIGLPILAVASDDENVHATRAALIGAALLAFGVALALWGMISALRRK